MGMKNRPFRHAVVTGTLFIVAGLAFASRSTAQPAPARPQFGAWGFDIPGVNQAAKPGDSFYDYANGAWDTRTAIPADKTRFGMFDALRDKSVEQLREIIEDAAKSNSPSNTEFGKIGALYSAFMDEARIEYLDAAPIADDLARIRDAKTKADIAILMGRSRGDLGASIFAIRVGEDQKDPVHNSLYASQSGLGLPDRDYYLKDAFQDKKTKYREYIARILDMVDWPNAQNCADNILAFETQVADASWTRTENRDRDKTYNPAKQVDLEKSSPGFPWSIWLASAQLSHVDRVIIRQSTAFPHLAKIFFETPLDTLQAWEAFRIADQAAPFLSKRFVDAHFEFHNRQLVGQLENLPRWKRAVQLVDASLGEAVGCKIALKSSSG
jgi:putative endopeptidase